MQLLILLPVFVAAGAVQSITGFGAGVIMMMVLPWFLDMVSAPALSGAITIGLTALLAWRYRKSLSVGSIILPLLVYTAASVLTVPLVRGFDMDLLSVLLGLFLLGLSLFFLLFSGRISLRDSRAAAVGFSLPAGIISGLFSLGGPLMTVYFVSVTESREDYLARSQLLYALSGSLTLISRIANGIYTTDLIPLTLAGILGINLGKILGLRISGRIRGEAFKKLVYVCVGISGLITIAEHI